MFIGGEEISQRFFSEAFRYSKEDSLKHTFFKLRHCADNTVSETAIRTTADY